MSHCFKPSHDRKLHRESLLDDTNKETKKELEQTLINWLFVSGVFAVASLSLYNLHIEYLNQNFSIYLSIIALIVTLFLLIVSFVDYMIIRNKLTSRGIFPEFRSDALAGAIFISIFLFLIVILILFFHTL